MAFLETLKGPLAGQIIALNRDRMVLGRSTDCDVIILHPAVARQHACITRREDGYYLEDLKSRGGTYLNGVQTRREPVRLKENDSIQFCDSLFRFRDDNAPQEQPG